ncbi:MAG: amidohydrolase family protein [Parasphingorhabdus sp.]|nr:amidohydrolase family protein [Parasphingorhabdus sp.]
MAPFEVIDMHQHLECGTGLKGALDFGGSGKPLREQGDVEFQHRLSMMAVHNMRSAVVMPGNMYLRPNGLADTAQVNDQIAAYRDRAAERFHGVGIVEPIYGPAGYMEVKRCKEELGLVGIGFHNKMQGVPVDSPLMFRLIEKVGEAGLVPFIHALGNDLESIWQVDLLAKAFPDLPMVILDAFHDLSQVKSLPDIAERRPNLYFDLSMSISFEFMGKPQVKTVGADRFVFGTNFYSLPVMDTPMGRPLEQILESDLPDMEKIAILSGNAKRILGLA